MSVRKRILPRTSETRWQVDYRDQTGKRRARQFITKREADAYETKVRSELVHGIHVADSASVTVAEAVQIWVDACRSDGLQESTIKQYDEHRRLHIVPLIGNVKLSQLSTPRCEAFKDDLLKTRSRALSRAVLTSFKGAIGEARRQGLIATNPAEAVKVKRRRSEDDESDEIIIPTKDQIRTMVAKAPEIWPLVRTVTTRDREQKTVPVPWQPFNITAIFTGMRQSELRGLAWPFVDFRANLIRVRQRADRWGIIGPVKTDASKRDIPMMPIVARTLKEWKMACPATGLDLVFPSERGHVLLQTNVLNQGFYPLLEACDLFALASGPDEEPEPLFHFHCLRHAAASLFIEKWGTNPKKVQTVMGHSSIQVTFDIYGHLFPSSEDDQQDMADLEARLLR